MGEGPIANQVRGYAFACADGTALVVTTATAATATTAASHR
jgi:hypothetical protein